MGAQGDVAQDTRSLPICGPRFLVLIMGSSLKGCPKPYILGIIIGHYPNPKYPAVGFIYPSYLGKP